VAAVELHRGGDLIRCESLTQTYHTGGRELTVLRDVSFEIATGSFVAVVASTCRARAA